MTAFLWTVVILMAAALLAEILAFAGMAILAKRTARRASEVTEQVSQRVQACVRLVNETQAVVRPRLKTLAEDSREISTVLVSRYQSVQAAYADASRRAEGARIRLSEGVQTVQEHQRAVQRDIVEPVEAAGKILSGLRLAMWLLRRVA